LSDRSRQISGYSEIGRLIDSVTLRPRQISGDSEID